MRTLLAFLLLAGGGGAFVAGVRLTARRRPLDLVGALVAPLGLLAILVAITALAVPGFFGGPSTAGP